MDGRVADASTSTRWCVGVLWSSFVFCRVSGSGPEQWVAFRRDSSYFRFRQSPLTRAKVGRIDVLKRKRKTFAIGRKDGERGRPGRTKAKLAQDAG